MWDELVEKLNNPKILGISLVFYLVFMLTLWKFQIAGDNPAMDLTTIKIIASVLALPIIFFIVDKMLGDE